MLRRVDDVIKRAQNKYLAGPLMFRLNRELVGLVRKEKPDAVFIYRGTHVFPSTLREIRKAGTVLIGYNNDDPFSPSYPRWFWRHFVAGVPEYDLVLAYRSHNLKDLLATGARRVDLLRSWFVPDRNFPVELNEQEKSRFSCDVVFIGHYEPDGRDRMLEAIVQKGYRLRLFGPRHDWDRVTERSPLLRQLHPVLPVWGGEYNKALCGAKIALCFFSKLNRDTYTRRCFEIPSTGTMMLSAYSSDLATMFTEGKDAEFFRSTEEMLKKIEYYLAHDARRREIAEAGRLRVMKDGHDVESRMRQVVGWINEIRELK